MDTIRQFSVRLSCGRPLGTAGSVLMSGDASGAHPARAMLGTAQTQRRCALDLEVAIGASGAILAMCTPATGVSGFLGEPSTRVTSQDPEPKNLGHDRHDNEGKEHHRDCHDDQRGDVQRKLLQPRIGKNSIGLIVGENAARQTIAQAAGRPRSEITRRRPSASSVPMTHDRNWVYRSSTIGSLPQPFGQLMLIPFVGRITSGRAR